MNLLMMKLQKNGMNTLQASSDADVDIVETAINKSQNFSVTVIGDVDLAVLLIAITPTYRDILILKPGREKVKTSVGEEPYGGGLSWGWERRNDQLVPKLSELDAAPDETLKIIFCRCTKGCDSGWCSCEKASLNCSVTCPNCKGNCNNGVAILIREGGDYDDIDTLPISLDDVSTADEDG
ncbi:hypothetical protein JTB14_029443 [Gonioctena quinquepunctata]|nr:hypothetical protein JTB14_029443 [Gonioctena quinquepunctata]